MSFTSLHIVGIHCNLVYMSNVLQFVYMQLHIEKGIQLSISFPHAPTCFFVIRFLLPQFFVIIILYVSLLYKFYNIF